MTPPARPLPSHPHIRLGRRAIALVALVALAAIAGPTVLAGEDDFEFGRKLAEARYFEYARHVFNQIIGSPARSGEDKGEAKYGLALLRREEAIASTNKRDIDYPKVVELFDGAVKDIAAFVDKNPKNRNATQARLDVGTIRLAFVQWARELLDDQGAMDELGINSAKLAEDAGRSVDQAIKYFDGLRPAEDNMDPKPYQELASYYYVISQYYKALVEPPCSPSAKTALEAAGDDLEQYIMDHDGELLAVYAQDIYGLVWWERAKCADDPEKKFDYFMKAFEWFETCVYTEDEGPDHQRVITSGYYHMAQAGLDAGRFPKRNFARDALRHLESMLDAHPTAWRSENGLRAMVEWSKLECQRGNANKAVEVARDAAERAKTAGKGQLERLANRQLNVYVAGGCGGSVGGLDASVLQRVADDLFARGQYREAIRAYRAVINSTSSTVQDFLAYQWNAWKRMAQAYGQLGDRLGEALAYEPIHDAWLQGIIPYVKGDKEDANMMRAGDDRRRAEVAMKDLATTTNAKVFVSRHKGQQDSFLKDYPDHSSTGVGEIRKAGELYNRAMEERGRNNPAWKRTLAQSRTLWRKFSLDPDNILQDRAFVYLIRSDIEEEKFESAVAEGKKAFKYWESPDAKARAKKHSSVRTRRDQARAAATYWLARAELATGKPTDALKTLEGYHDRFSSFPSPRYPAMAFDLMVQANLDLKDISEADRYYRKLLAAQPDYYNIPKITSLLAGHYNEQRDAIEEKLNGVSTVLREKRIALRRAEKESFRLSALVADLKNLHRKAEQAIQMWEEDKDKPLNDRRIDKKDADEKRVQKADLDKRIPEEQKRLSEWAPKRDALRIEVKDFHEQQRALEQEIYQPLVDAARYYKEWDDSLKLRGADRSPSNVAGFGQMFAKAGRLRPNEHENWVAARALIEDYLAFPEIQKLPLSNEAKRTAIGRLGNVYVRLAEQETDPDKQRALVMNAMERLQSSLADRAADNQLVVEMLADKILVLKWREGQKRWRFAVPRPENADELRAAVRKLGKVDEGGHPLPEFDTEDERLDYKRALGLFRRELEALDDREIKRLVVSKDKTAFDPVLYRELANSNSEFRLALAWVYSHTGRDEDRPKALNLALSLIAPPLGVEDGTEIWWQAREIQMRLYLDAALRRMPTSGTASSEAAQFLERAGVVFQGIGANFPNLGDDEFPGNRDHWLEILDEMNKLRGRVPMTAILPPEPPTSDSDAGLEGAGSKPAEGAGSGEGN